MSEHRNRTTCVDKHEIVVDRHHTINIVVEGGMVVEVDGLPVDWQYYICLLYTSPSPRDATLSRMPSSA